ncbi:hypothetical protein DDB_G0287715 [Dictyostelium discoideum AX4]|uniref:Uncharacterized protein n=1 Tax=Dictyostelium discoideum TaxID=44689 RepID=Q54JZ7_DICDI|nr:hypothetical protein DDB_G0287715 [Dictyostelium discoideum AX4]EAL63504.1 hypothetical protein DDB_G0287715 [Dictyostelium discoideum AX4]|eukprot:XP_637005.1 hypothetical protein DDB_G0287715 [Dictyostelium discoideum AX4]
MQNHFNKSASDIVYKPSKQIMIESNVSATFEEAQKLINEIKNIVSNIK